jgi:hypothetical protein
VTFAAATTADRCWRHAGPLAFFAALAIAWTWPLARHLSDAIPGVAGDNYSFLWNLWWMRHVRATPDLAFFRTTFLFYPFGTTIANHPHTALPGFVAATALNRLSLAAAQNVIVLVSVFANMASMYWLAWTVTRHRRAALLAGVMFGTSPYFSVHLLGHFDLLAGWVLPMFALLFHRAVEGRSRTAAIASGLVLAATAYTAYYYVVYIGLFAVTCVFASARWIRISWRRRREARNPKPLAISSTGSVPAASSAATRHDVQRRNRRTRRTKPVVSAGSASSALIAVSSVVRAPACRRSWLTSADRLQLARASLIALAVSSSALALWIVLTGGTALQLGGVRVSLRQPQNPLSMTWLALIGAALCTWRPAIAIDRQASPLRHALAATAWIVAVFGVACAPIIIETARLVRHGEYVTPTYFWRSAPRGVDLIGPLIGHPRHPLTRTLGQRAYDAMRADYIETVSWIGIVPVLLLARPWPFRRAVDAVAWRRLTPGAAPDARLWWIVGGVFGLWAAGPFLTVRGFDTGLWLPETLARYIPFVANARVPGRAMVGVYMALAMLAAIRISASDGWWRSPATQWLLIAAVTFDYFAAPVPLTTLDDPAPYHALAAAPAGAVCEVPFGIGDGLGPGAGAQDRRVLFYATIHAHPLAGGYIGRMPADAERRYLTLPTTSTLLHLSRREDEDAGADAQASAEPDREAIDGPCRYLVVNRPAASDKLQAYVKSLPVELLASDGIRDVYRLVR